MTPTDEEEYRDPVDALMRWLSLSIPACHGEVSEPVSLSRKPARGLYVAT